MSVTKEELKSGMKMVVAIGQAIREAGQIPSGHLYAVLMDKVTLEGYDKILGILKNANVVQEDDSHMLKWIGPK